MVVNYPKFSDSTLEIDLSAIKHNYKLSAEMANGSRCGAVVKANCYGLGVSEIVPVLVNAGCSDFFVATLDEALELSEIEETASSDIYVFHGIKTTEVEEFNFRNITPVLNDISQVEIWSAYARKINKVLPAIINFDTGMNRLGINYNDAGKLARSEMLQSLDIKYLMSHLSSITSPEHPLNKLQLERVENIRKTFPKIPVTLANSRGVFEGRQYHYDLVRPGCYLYGIRGSSGAEVKNVVTLRARIIQIREITEDGFVGYGADYEVKKGARIAVVPVGYADGYNRILTGNSYAYYNNIKIPLIGRVSMDMTIFDVSGIPKSQINIGDEVELIGDNIGVDEVACNAQTIGYEILTGLGSRLLRKYKY